MRRQQRTPETNQTIPALNSNVTAASQQSARLLFGAWDCLRKPLILLKPSIPHDLSMVRFLNDRILVMKGAIVELSSAEFGVSIAHKPNLRFDEIDDPKGLCRDVTDLGRWGNGDVEVGISLIDQLDDVMFLIRQAFDRHSEDISV